MTELLVGTKKGLFALEGEPGGDFEVIARAFAGEPVEYAMRDPRTGRRARVGDLAVLRPEALLHRRPASDWGAAKRPRMGAGRGRRAARGRRAGARADLGDRARRGRRRCCTRAAIRACCSRAATAASTWELNRRPVGAPDAPEVAAGRRRAVPALDRPVAGRARPAGGRDLGGRRVAHRRRRRDRGGGATRG